MDEKRAAVTGTSDRKKTLDEGAQQGLLGRVVPQEWNDNDGQWSQNLRKFDWSFACDDGEKQIQDEWQRLCGANLL